MGVGGAVEIEMLSPIRPYHRLGIEEKQLGSQGRASEISTQSEGAKRRAATVSGVRSNWGWGDRLKSLRLRVCLSVLLRLMSRPAY